MRFRHSISISIDNFGSVFKLLLYRLITGVLFFSLTYVILKLSLSVITESAEMSTLKSLIGDFFRSIVSGESERLHSIQEEFHTATSNLLDLISAHSSSIVGAIIGLCAMYILSRFANGLGVFAVGNTINDRMSVFARTSFSQAYFKNIGQAMLYQVIYVPLAFIYDVLSIGACWFLFFYAPSFLPSWGILTTLFALALTVTALVCLQALKMTVISSWMPAMIADKKSTVASLKGCFHKKDFARRFAAYLASIYLIVIVNVISALSTFGSALLVSIPLSFIFLLVMQFVNYYKQTGRKYFVSLHHIAGGEDENSSLME